MGKLENFRKKPKLLLSGTQKESPAAANIGQFASPVTEETYSEAGKRVLLMNMTQCSSWALRIFHAWAAE